MSARLSKARKAELAPQAVAMSARGKTHHAISKELGINRNTVGKLIEDELAATAEHRVNDREKHLSVIRQAQKAAWEVFDNADYRSQNKVSSLNAILAGEAQASRLTGAEMPKKNEHTGPDGGPIEVADARDELRERLARFEISVPAE